MNLHEIDYLRSVFSVNMGDLIEKGVFDYLVGEDGKFYYRLTEKGCNIARALKKGRSGAHWQLNNDSYSIESSQMQNRNCPKCNLPITKSHITKIDKDNSDEDVYGWHYYHPCGTTLFIIND